MKLMRLTRGRDIIDLRTYPGFPDDEKFVFHALDSKSPRTTPELRGRAVEVSEKHAEEMLTHPVGVFEEVTAEQAESDRYRASLRRDPFGVWRDPRTGLPVDPSQPLVAPVLAADQGEPTPPEQLRDEVKRALQGAAPPPDDGGTAGGKRSRQKSDE
jgi:hypothetical protein